ncbi:ankyrin repeat domain-containing protein [Leptospira ilyithenensis]|uniref:Ankyrin repeat domain-containing protein n=1 Tax=Leptospira ilyithenensis TaxID=2484901 RepID=A0A4R9LJ67_9LEPT|nr:ankyrin repeat domain-containing protein [Leptospira ilyithenensis]TGN06916.1 ankyrin repeat domain-containing protein [Leptospira ilyithenensis]
MKRTALGTLLIFLVIGCATFPDQGRNYRYNNFYFQVAQGNVERVREILRTGQNPNIPEDTFDQMTPLMIASKEGHHNVVHVLLTYKANPNLKSRNGHTALMMAAYNRYPKVVEYLLDAGADPNLKSEAGHTALSEIQQSEKETIIHLLKSKGAVE